VFYNTRSHYDARCLRVARLIPGSDAGFAAERRITAPPENGLAQTGMYRDGTKQTVEPCNYVPGMNE